MCTFPYLSNVGGVRAVVADTEAIRNILPVHLEDEAEPVWALGSLPGREVTHDPRGRGILGILQQEVPVDGILTGDGDKLIGEPNLRKITSRDLENHEE